MLLIGPVRTVHEQSSGKHAVTGGVNLMSHYDLIQLLL